MRGALAVAILALLAGCAQPEDANPEEAVAAIEDDPRDDGPCPPQWIYAQDGTPAPLWTVGDYWNYTTFRENGTVDGWRNETVVAVAPFTDVSPCAYTIEVRSSSRYGTDPQTGQQSIGTQAEYVEARTMHAVWDLRPECLTHGPCQGEDTWPYDFPLWDGKEWDKTSGGDVIWGIHVVVTQEQAEGRKGQVFRVTHYYDAEDLDPDAGREEYVFDPVVGHTIWSAYLYGSEIVEGKELREHSYQKAPIV